MMISYSNDNISVNETLNDKNRGPLVLKDYSYIPIYTVLKNDKDMTINQMKKLKENLRIRWTRKSYKWRSSDKPVNVTRVEAK